jgi:hypothetical protein
VAFRALHSEDRLLRGLGMEYLEGVLPAGLGVKLTGLLEDAPAAGTAAEQAAVLDRLMASNQSLVLELKSPSGGVRPKGGTQSPTRPPSTPR